MLQNTLPDQLYANRVLCQIGGALHYRVWGMADFCQFYSHFCRNLRSFLSKCTSLQTPKRFLSACKEFQRTRNKNHTPTLQLHKRTERPRLQRTPDASCKATCALFCAFKVASCIASVVPVQSFRVVRTCNYGSKFVKEYL